MPRVQLTAGAEAQLRYLFNRVPRALFPGDTLSHQAMRELADAYLAERLEDDSDETNWWRITEGGVAWLFGGEPVLQEGS